MLNQHPKIKHSLERKVGVVDSLMLEDGYEKLPRSKVVLGGSPLSSRLSV